MSPLAQAVPAALTHRTLADSASLSGRDLGIAGL
jgi:hypothetical protein